MERFIRYFYEYKQDKRIRNVGFVKVEAGNDETTLHMQGKGFHESDDRKLALYLFYEENGNIVCIQQEMIRLTGPVLSCHLTYTRDNVGIPENYRKINGILAETENGRRFAATWDDKTVDVSRMREFSLQMDKSESKDEKVKDSVQDTDELNLVEKEADKRSETICPQCTKIQRQDISKLPRCEWKHANNQFLVHGYRNYHHLLLIEEENNLKLGVPGIYHIKEAECAKDFGFGEFLNAKELGILPDEADGNREELFGYWCRPVRRKQERQ